MCGNSRSDRDVWCRKTLTRGHYLIAISFTNLKHTGMQNYEEYSSDSDSYSSSDYQSSEDLGLEEKDNYGIWIYGVGGVKIDKIKEGYTKKKLMNFFIKGLISYVSFLPHITRPSRGKSYGRAGTRRISSRPRPHADTTSWLLSARRVRRRRRETRKRRRRPSTWRCRL